jgi:AsmA-like C-terminal region
VVSAPNTITTSELCATPFSLDSVHLGFRYTQASGFDIAPSQVATNVGRATVSGTVAPAPSEAAGSWRYDLTLTDAALGSGDEGFKPIPFAGARLRGRTDPATGLITLDRLHVPLGTATLDVAGRTVDGGVRLEGAVEGLTSDDIKRLWPACVSVDARQWLRRSLHSATVEKARFAIVQRPASVETPVAVGIDGTLSDMAFTAIEGMPPVRTPSAHLKFATRSYTVEAETAGMTLGENREITLKNARFNIPNLWEPRPMGTLTADISSSVPTALAFLDHEPLRILNQEGMSPPPMDGQQTGSWTVAFPIIHHLKPEHFAISGKVKAKSLSSTDTSAGALAIRGGALDLDVTPGAVGLSGDILVNGVNFKVSGRHLAKWAPAAASLTAQPLTMTALLDDAARDQLGIAVNHIMRGDIPIRVVQVLPAAAAPAGKPAAGPFARVEADLTDAELVLDTMAWRKPPGSDAKLTFDVQSGDKGGTRLANVRLVGANIGVGGEITLNADHRLSAFDFPTFTVDVVTQLALSGRMRPDNVLAVNAEGRTFDGRKLIRSMFSVGRVTERDLPQSKDSNGIDLEARIGTLIGANDVSLHDLRVTLSRRKGKLTALRVAAIIDGGSSVAIGLGDGPTRTLVAETKDAGAAFKMVGLYRSMEGGEASLQVDLDSDSALEKSGTLWARRFTVLGDPVVEEMMTKTPGNDDPVIRKRRKGQGQRERIAFQNLRIPFRVGGGKLQLGESFINGPLIGATLRGTVDFEGERVQLAGTYIPLFGLNTIFSGVPVFSELLGKGIFGVTFAIEGPSERPQVLVNPISMVAPGIFRSIFEFDPGAMDAQANRPKKRRARQAGGVGAPPSPSVGEALEPQEAP